MAKQRPRRDPGTPLSLPSSVSALLGDESTALLAALAGEGPISIRLNPCKQASISGDPVPWCANGRYLPERPSFTLDPLLHAGAYYVQEASSMLLEQAFSATGLGKHDLLALDLCAAPGGKSTHLVSLASEGSLLVSNEVVTARRDALMENLWKHGAKNTVVTGSAASDFSKLPGTFDLVLVDAPCSGEGMFRKDPFARQQWNERLVSTCARTQRDILPHAWTAVRPGGYLIYSTCTWERSENEEQVLELLRNGAEFTPIPMAEDWGVVATDAGYRCYPHRVRGEGLFIALLRKPGEFAPYPRSVLAGEHLTDVAEWLDKPEASTILEERDNLFATPAHWSHTLERLRVTLRMGSPGIPIAERKGDGWRPHPALALNELLRPGAFPALDLDRQQALTYLRGETTLPLGSNAPDAPGVRLMRYAGLPLGWMHAAGDRWNNGWPKPWRIRMR